MSWGLNDIKEARTLLNLRFDDAPCTVEVVQEMVTALVQDHGQDEREIERAITQHFKKKKG